MPGAGADNPRAGYNSTVARLKGHLLKKKRKKRKCKVDRP